MDAHALLQKILTADVNHPLCLANAQFPQNVEWLEGSKQDRYDLILKRKTDDDDIVLARPFIIGHISKENYCDTPGGWRSTIPADVVPQYPPQTIP